jgi:hypothetical protein
MRLFSSIITIAILFTLQSCGTSDTDQTNEAESYHNPKDQEKTEDVQQGLLIKLLQMLLNKPA